jgi:protein-S-isoprenylcysteine O-methyltransferase Ste14
MVIRNTILILAAFLSFMVIHSLMAGVGLKSRLVARLGERLVEGWYRLFYNLWSAVTILPTLVLIVFLPDRVLYHVGMPWALLLRGIQLLGLIGLAGALFVTDVWRFVGVSQVLAYLSGDPLPLPPEPFQQNGMYTVVRHPLYFFSLIVIWFTPALTLNFLIFNLGATLYFVVGSLIEEQRLLRIYGDVYRQYRRRVSWLIPWFPRSP